MTRIAILDDYQNVALEMADWSTLPGDATVTVFNDHEPDSHNLGQRLKGYEAVCIMRERTPFNRAVFEKLPDLKLLVTTGMRNASVDLEAATDHGVIVCGTAGSAHTTPELTWGLILSLARSIPFEHGAMRAGRWQTTLGYGLKGRTLGLLGLGRLGADVARVGRAFGMNLIAWSQNLTEERATEHGAALVSKQDLFRQSDFLSIHLVLSDRSRGLVGREELDLMKPTSFLINTSRGPIVDEDALVDVLERRQIAGAGLDVYGLEPLPRSHPLRGLDNTVLTPHIGYVTEDTYEIFYRDTVECLQSWLNGSPVRVLNPAES